jgi:predicted rRNA methylase YqxC with S4 and FtsJ domains
MAVENVVEALGVAGPGPLGIIPSPVTGGDGNVEYLVWARKGESPQRLEVPD